MHTEHADHQRWLLSFYRTSEINGALFFGRLARTIRSGPIQADMTRHFADESQHARWWTDCIQQLGDDPLKLRDAYQDQYLEAGGMPVNLMEILAVTLVFERRVVGQYAAHARVPGLAQPIRDTLARIMNDEKWHIKWVSEALKKMESEYGAAEVEKALKRYSEADQEVYRRTLDEHQTRLASLMTFKSR
jgi:bacterioferritin (cytochrome b1)